MAERQHTSIDWHSWRVGVGIFVLLLPIYWLFIHFNDETRGFVVVCVTGAAFVACYVQRRERHRVRRWVTVALLYVLQLPLLLLVPLPAKLPGPTMYPVALLDAFALIWVSSLIERHVFQRSRIRQPSADEPPRYNDRSIDL